MKFHIRSSSIESVKEFKYLGQFLEEAGDQNLPALQYNLQGAR